MDRAGIPKHVASVEDHFVAALIWEIFNSHLWQTLDSIWPQPLVDLWSARLSQVEGVLLTGLLGWLVGLWRQVPEGQASIR